MMMMVMMMIIHPIETHGYALFSKHATSSFHRHINDWSPTTYTTNSYPFAIEDPWRSPPQWRTGPDRIEITGSCFKYE
jgi:hypothetical protein